VTRRSQVALAAGDAAALVLFVVIGLASHDDGITPRDVFRVALPILVLWFFAATFARTYRHPGVRTLVPAWFTGVIGGILVRYVVFHQPENAGKLFVFLGVGLAFTLLFLLTWRLIARLLLGLGRPVTTSVT
jgi:hypothetical protein